ncbi:eukaryotic translation initiation factor eIF-2 beta [Fadolivirus algeromassiliense]|jgi:translation initiation factor 2 subunit 2|uniref:Eukaryotic translation initiation factor eIF-2 beta n=1 Tax=Fadolivirus FV1/VV64 TaxID=3070911 RepID=A0A7D3UNX0_9VIRU|nr:eukaryotic translation initiation factor eIF-2 beta [Fadolivirus algeromassiliense]QKF93648.1 eukaryotic translation initiation factor eIF-2 beta [Fadolivirus FV1/VV64]
MELYTTEYLVNRLYTELSDHTSSSKKLSLEKPEISSVNKKTYISNFKSLCTKLNRDTNDVKMFFEKELQTSVSINQDGGLVITGMFKQPGLLKIFTNYIKEYVTCKECNSCDTEIIKENRITYLKCNKCLSKKAFN